MSESLEDVNEWFNEEERRYNLQVQIILTALSDRIDSQQGQQCDTAEIDLDELCEQLAIEINSQKNDHPIFDTELTGENVWNIQHNELHKLQVYRILCDLTHQDPTTAEFNEICDDIKDDIMDFFN